MTNLAGYNKQFERKQGETSPFKLFCYIWTVILHISGSAKNPLPRQAPFRW